jgi:hypothetical protein
MAQSLRRKVRLNMSSIKRQSAVLGRFYKTSTRSFLPAKSEKVQTKVLKPSLVTTLKK